MPAGTDIDIDKEIDIETGTDIDIDPVREMKYGTDSKRGERYRKSRPGRGRRRRRKRTSLFGKNIGFQTGFFRFQLGLHKAFVGRDDVSLFHIFDCLSHHTKQMEVKAFVIFAAVQRSHLKRILRVYPLKCNKGYHLKT